MEKKYRDGLFRNYFSDKRRLLGLCNLLTGEDATDPDEIEINTLDTINENMPLRILFYAAELLRQYVDERKKKIYLEKLIPLPQPQFFVFYNGRKKEAEHREMRLSDAFGGYTCLEVVVQMYNISAGMNEDLILHDESLNNYCIFLNLYHKFLSEGMDSAHALKAAFDYCISHVFFRLKRSWRVCWHWNTTPNWIIRLGLKKVSKKGTSKVRLKVELKWLKIYYLQKRR